MTECPKRELVEPSRLETEERAALENAEVASESAEKAGAANFAALVSPAEHLAVLATGNRLVEKGSTVPARGIKLETELIPQRQVGSLQRRPWFIL